MAEPLLPAFSAPPNYAQSGTSSTAQRLAAATTDAFSVGVTGDTVDRFVINADGKMEWGPGNGATDTTLERSGTSTILVAGLSINRNFGDVIIKPHVIASKDFNGTVSLGDGNTLKIKVQGQSFIVGGAAIATTATAGFIYLPSCAGTPTGVPTSETGTVATVIDTTNSKLYSYIGGAWKGVTLT